MADRFVKDPARIRGGTSVSIEVSFPWFDGKNKNVQSDVKYASHDPNWKHEQMGYTEYAKKFWANLTKENV